MPGTLRVAGRSLLQHKLRSGLSVLGIVCGVVAVLVMVSIGEGAKRKVLAQIERLGITNIYIKPVDLTDAQRQKARQNLSRGLSRQDMDRLLAGLNHAVEVSALKEIRAAVVGMSREVSPAIAAVTGNWARLLNIPVSQGRFVTDRDVADRNLVCVLGDAVYRDLGEKGRPGSLVRVENQLFKVVGVLGDRADDPEESAAALARNVNHMVFIPLGTEPVPQTAGPDPGNPPDALSEVIVQVDGADQVAGAHRVVQRILALAHNDTEDYQIILPQELMNQARRTRRTFNAVLGVIAGVSLVVGGIGIMNIMLASVTERTREIGIRRAVGATRADIVTQFLTEAVMLTLTGGVAGVVVGVAAVRAFALLVGWETVITLWAVALPLVTAVLVGIFFGLYPAYLAAGLDPIAALRHE